MSNSNESLITLASIGGGAAMELFDVEFQKVLKNIADVNTSPKKAREVSLKIVIVPDEDRDMGAAQVFVMSKLASIKPVKSSIYFGKKDGKLVAVESNPKQPGIFDTPEQKTALANVVPMSEARKANENA